MRGVSHSAGTSNRAARPGGATSKLRFQPLAFAADRKSACECAHALQPSIRRTKIDRHMHAPVFSQVRTAWVTDSSLASNAQTVPTSTCWRRGSARILSTRPGYCSGVAVGVAGAPEAIAEETHGTAFASSRMNSGPVASLGAR